MILDDKIYEYVIYYNLICSKDEVMYEYMACRKLLYIVNSE